MLGRRRLRVGLGFRRSVLRFFRRLGRIVGRGLLLAWMVRDVLLGRGRRVRCLRLRYLLVSIGMRRLGFWLVPIRS